MSYTKELKTNEKVVTTLVVIGGLLVCALMLTKCDNAPDVLGLKKRANKEAVQEEQVAVIDATPDIEEEKLVAPEIDPEMQTEVLRVKYKESQEQIIALTQELEKLKSQTAFSSSEENDGEGSPGQVKQLRNKIDALALEKDKITKEAAIKEQRLITRISELSGGSTEDPEAKTKQAIAKADTQWQQKFAALKVNHEQDKARIRAEHHEKLRDFRIIARKTKAKKTFASSPDDLAPAGKDLVESLQTYKGSTADELAAFYGNVAGQNAAKAKLAVNFGSGSSSVSDDYKAEIKTLLANAPEDSYFVAVGYADTTGTASKNKALSSKRATRVAEVLKYNLKKNQFTQAYYLGQTTRFGAEENNRVVEIWEITD